MGKLIYLMNVSLDGYVETHDHSLDWTNVDDELHTWFNDQMRTLQAALYGRRMYELMAAHWPTADADPSATEPMREFGRIWNPLLKVVFSSSLERVEHNSRLVGGDVGEVFTELRRELDGDLAVGGPMLASQFVQLGLVDEYRLIIHPVILGGGKPFWPDLDTPIRLRLTETRTFASGAVLMSYSIG